MSTLITLGVIAVLMLLLAIPGIPAAILISRGKTLAVAPTVALGLFLGLGIELAIVLGLVHFGAYTSPIFALAITVLSIGLWAAVLARPPRMLRPTFTPPGSAVAVIMGAAVLLRTDPIYFIYQTADFGEYVNRANVVASGGTFGAWFLNLFPATLSVPSLIFGSIHTVDAMPVLGLLLVIGIAAISHKLDFPPWATVVAAFIAAFHIVPVWFSEFPASEMLFAVLLTGVLVILTFAVAERSTTAALMAGSFGFLLAVARANAMLLAPVIVLASIAAIVLTDKDSAKIVTRFIWSFFAASLVGFFYDITFNFPYFVESQLGLFFPESVTEAVARLQNPLIAIGAGIALGVIVASMIALAYGIANRQNLARRLSVLMPPILLAVLFVFIARRALTQSYVSPAGQILILGPVVIGLAIAGVIIGAFLLPRMSSERRITYWIATVTAIAFAGLQAVRLDLALNNVAPYFLYWQRYYMSEIFPVAVILLLWPLEILMTRSMGFVRSDRLRRLAPAAVAVLAMSVIGIEAVGPNLAVASGSMFRDSYETIAELDQLTSDPPDAPIIYIGSNDLPDGWFWPNTSRIVALPLADTFGRQVVGIQKPREQDLEPSEAELNRILDALGVDTVYLISDRESSPDEAVYTSTDWAVSQVGAVDVTIERLVWDSDTAVRDQRYVSTTLRLLVYRFVR